MVTEYTRKNALLALPHLVQAAQQRKILTYGELSQKIGLHWRAARHFLGCIRDEICIPRELPLINAIVVSQATGLPGDSWLPGGVYELTREQKKGKYEEYRDKVFAYPNWEDLLAELGLAPIPRSFEDLDDEGRAYSDYLSRKGGAGEAESHRALKEFIAKRPEILELNSIKKSFQEYKFISDDKCDVVFELETEEVAVVEIKNGIRGELVKGIYQVIKYRALMIAEKGHGQDHPVNGYLVAYEIPNDIRQFANHHNIKCTAVDRSRIIQ